MKNLALSGVFLLCLSYAAAQQPVAYLSTDKALADIAQLTSVFEAVHYNPYFNTSKAEYEQLKARLIGEWPTDSVSYRKFMATGMQLAAAMSGGHSYMYWQNGHIVPELKSHLYLPFTGRLSNGGDSFVVTKSGSSAFSRGMQVRSVNGISLAELFRECTSYIGGIAAFRAKEAEKLFPVYLFFNGQLQPPYEIEMEGTGEAVMVPGLGINELGSVLNAGLPQEDYTFEALGDGMGLLTYNSCTGYKKFRKFLKKAFAAIKKQQIDKLMIDIRENGGGDSRLNDLLLAYLTDKPYRQSSGRYWKVSQQAKAAYAENRVYEKIFGKDFMARYMRTPDQEVIVSMDSTVLTQPERPKHYFSGKSCMLIGPGTFSSANFLADAVKTYGLTTLIGAPTGECTNDFGEQLSFSLHHSGAQVFISSTYDIGANGDPDVLEPVYPDLPVEGDALEYAKEWLRNGALH